MVIKLVALYMADFTTYWVLQPQLSTWKPTGAAASLAFYVITRRRLDPTAIRAGSYLGGTFHSGYLGSQHFTVF